MMCKIALVLSISLLCLGITPMLAQSPKELARHEKEKENSRKRGDVIISLDTVFDSGTPFCRFRVLKSGLYNSEIRVFDLHDNEVLFINSEHYDTDGVPATTTDWKYYLVLTALNTQQKVEMPYVYGATNIAKRLVQEGLFRQGELDTTVVRNLRLRYGSKFSEERARLDSAPKPAVTIVNGQPYGSPAVVGGTIGGASASPMVERNRSLPVMVFGNQVQQGGVVIGRITTSQWAVVGGVQRVIRYVLPNGTLVAEAHTTAAIGFPCTWTVVTARDNRQHLVNGQPTQDETLIARYLVQNLYL